MTQQEYTALVDRAKQLSYEYYVLAAPTVSDQEFDALVSDIEQAEQQHPDWTLADSPTQQVGSDLTDNGRRLIRHRTPMLSCQKAQTQEAVTKWMTQTEKRLKKTGDLHYVLEWKLDGISCSLVYQDGRLVSAATRGDKNCGQDLLAHVMMMPSVPQRIDMTGRVEVRGEIVCPKKNLSRLGYKDCRTAAASLCNQQRPTGDIALLEFAAWQMDTADPIGTETASMELAAGQGFKTSGYRGCRGMDVLARLDEFEASREAFEWPTDGVVVKIDARPLAQSLGATEHHPKGNIAYKFVAQKAVTRVVGIEVKVGATGRRTPVAYLEPVTILGREVSSASLGSERKMQELGICEGCKVEVGLSNDVTPKIYRVISSSGQATESTDRTESEGTPAVNEGTPQGSPIVSEDTPATAPATSATATPVLEASPAIPSQEEEEPTISEYERQREHLALLTERKRQRLQRETEQRRQREERNARIARESENRQRKAKSHSILKAVGMFAAACVACVVIYETGFLIPLGLIGLATSGLVK